jgi:hypothetical protein
MPANIPSAETSDIMTRRQELNATLKSQAACLGCHALIDDLGYAYGHFDEAGDYEATEDGLPIDTSGSFGLTASSFGPEPVILSFANVQELGEGVAASCEARKGLASSFARAALGLEGLPVGTQFTLVEEHRARLEWGFLASETRSYEDLVRAYAQSPLVLQR